MARNNLTAKSKVPGKVTQQSLEKSAVYYLGRYSTSSENLRRILFRKVRRSAQFHETDLFEGEFWINQIIKKFLVDKLLDDFRYAEMKCLSLHRKGGSKKSIRKKLQEKGVATDIIDKALSSYGMDTIDPELIAAAITARRRRLGPYRTRGQRSNFREKDLASLARAGFNYSTASWIIDVETIERLEKEIGLNQM